MKILTIIFTIFIIFFSGCAWFETEKEKTADELIAEGLEYYEDESYKKAIESFEDLKNWYPFSKYAIVAELKIADAHYHLEEYEEAVFAYEEFENLHPRNEKTPYAVYQIAKCHFNRVDTIDRDQTSARKALDTFNRLIKYYPDSSYVPQAKEERNECIKSLAGNELYVALFYYKTEYYKAALYRFKAIITDYPDIGTHQIALQYIPMCEAAMKASEPEQKQEK
jgi:outer membrane protein assembly factor BamD